MQKYYNNSKPMNQYFDEPPDIDDYSICYRRFVYHGTLIIPFRIRLANHLAQRFRREKIKHFLTQYSIATAKESDLLSSDFPQVNQLLKSKKYYGKSQ